MSFYCIYHCYIYHLFCLLHLSRFISESASGSVDASWSLKSLFVVLRMFSTWLALERSPPTPGHPIVFLMAAAQLSSGARCSQTLTAALRCQWSGLSLSLLHSVLYYLAQ